jgi:hypothetical protein
LLLEGCFGGLYPCTGGSLLCLRRSNEFRPLLWFLEVLFKKWIFILRNEKTNLFGVLISESVFVALLPEILKDVVQIVDGFPELALGVLVMPIPGLINHLVQLARGGVQGSTEIAKTVYYCI